MEMMENDSATFEKPPIVRKSSCAYPKALSSPSSRRRCRSGSAPGLDIDVIAERARANPPDPLVPVRPRSEGIPQRELHRTRSRLITVCVLVIRPAQILHFYGVQD